jgi:hypothetical protein
MWKFHANEIEAAKSRACKGIRWEDKVAKKKGTKRYDIPTEIRRLARERVGTLPSPKLIVPKKQRKRPKHKRPPGEETE